jgi:hypothetical protein
MVTRREILERNQYSLRTLSKLVAISTVALACGLASLPAEAQTYSAGSTALAWTSVATLTLTTNASSGITDEAQGEYGPATGYQQMNGFNPFYTEDDVSGIEGTYYAAATFNETAGLYNFALADSGYSNSSLSDYVYDGTFNPGTGTNDDQSALTNVASDDLLSRTTGTYQEYLPVGSGAGGTGTMVDSDLYAPGTAGKTVTGTDTVTITELNATVITQGTPAGVSMSTTDTGSGTIGSTTNLSSLSIYGLYSTFDGDLSATLTHDGVTVSIFDNPGASSANYGLGNWNLLTNTLSTKNVAVTNVYTFANTGSAFSAGNDATIAGGTYGLSNSGTVNGGQNNFATTFAAFNGLSEAGTWTLNIANDEYGDNSYFSGFNINLVPLATPEASTLISMILAVSLMSLLVWKARCNRFEVTALKGVNNE